MKCDNERSRTSESEDISYQTIRSNDKQWKTVSEYDKRSWNMENTPNYL